MNPIWNLPAGNQGSRTTSRAQVDIPSFIEGLGSQCRGWVAGRKSCFECIIKRSFPAPDLLFLNLPIEVARKVLRFGCHDFPLACGDAIASRVYGAELPESAWIVCPSCSSVTEVR